MKNLNTRTIQRLHAKALIMSGLGLATLSTYAQQTGETIYGFLNNHPMGQVGLLQAYLLMAIIGLSILIGTSGKQSSETWSVIGIIAHLPPLFALSAFGYLFAEMDLSYMIFVGTFIHATWIAVELAALFFLKPGHKEFDQ